MSTKKRRLQQVELTPSETSQSVRIEPCLSLAKDPAKDPIKEIGVEPDYTIVSNGSQLRVHQSVLCLNSEFFRTGAQFKSEKFVFDLQVSSQSVFDYIRLLYGSLITVTLENATDIMIILDYVSHVQQSSDNALLHFLSVFAHSLPPSHRFRQFFDPKTVGARNCRTNVYSTFFLSQERGLCVLTRQMCLLLEIDAHFDESSFLSCGHVWKFGVTHLHCYSILQSKVYKFLFRAPDNWIVTCHENRALIASNKGMYRVECLENGLECNLVSEGEFKLIAQHKNLVWFECIFKLYLVNLKTNDFKRLDAKLGNIDAVCICYDEDEKFSGINFGTRVFYGKDGDVLQKSSMCTAYHYPNAIFK